MAATHVVPQLDLNATAGQDLPSEPVDRPIGLPDQYLGNQLWSEEPVPNHTGDRIQCRGQSSGIVDWSMEIEEDVAVGRYSGPQANLSERRKRSNRGAHSERKDLERDRRSEILDELVG